MKKPRLSIYWLQWLFMALVMLVPSRAVLAADEPPEAWVEIRMGHFVILCPASAETDYSAFRDLNSQALNAAFDQFASLYGTQPQLPINIRVYQDLDQLRELNSVIPRLSDSDYHVRLGSREIALILPLPAAFITSTAAADVLRDDVHNLFLTTLAGEALPAGLAAGLNQYVRSPDEQTTALVDQMRSAVGRGSTALLTWRSLLERSSDFSGRDLADAQALSVVAYLADAYGFGTVVDLLRTIGAGRPYRNALADVYGRPMDQLELDWQDYLPLYVDERWTYNVLYNYDLSPLEQGVQAGAYTQVVRALEFILPFLKSTGQTAALGQAQTIQALAEQGIAAGALVKDVRDALQAGELRQTLELAQQAQAAYIALGNSSRLDEIAAYAVRAQGLLDLQSELAAAQAALTAGDSQAAEQQFVALAPKFQAAGDKASLQAVQAALEAIQAQRTAAAARAAEAILEQLQWIGVAVGVVLLHRLLALWWSRRRGAPVVL